jgi:antitoxin component YwqK of YwqJK toxin-antitoxin module
MSDNTDSIPARYRFLRRSVLCLLLGCAVSATVVFLPRPKQNPQHAIEEASPGSLQMREGRWYCHGGVEPFTGILCDYYANGARKSRSAVSNGFLEGVSEGWHTNGQKQITEFYRAGISHGTRTKWHETGSKLSEVTVVDGKLEGTFYRYYEDGQLAESITLRNGLPDGPSCSYYPSGFLKVEARLANGRLIEQKLWNDGERKQPSLGS